MGKRSSVRNRPAKTRADRRRPGIDPEVQSWLDNVIIPNLFDKYMATIHLQSEKAHE
jgi:hypothetical protein